MRTTSWLLSTVVLLSACKSDPPATKIEPAAKPDQVVPTDERTSIELELGSHASKPYQAAMADLAKLDAALTGDDPFANAGIRAAWTGPLHAWVTVAQTALGRTDAALIDESMTRLEDLTDPLARRRELVVMVTQIRTVALLDVRRLLTEASDADPRTAPALTRAGQWDDAHCLWDTALRPLAERADGLAIGGGEDWAATIADAFTRARADLDSLATVKASRQIVEKGVYAIAFRLILANAERRDRLASAEAAGLLELLDDRIADRNSPGLKRMRRMLNGDPSQVDPLLIERELAVAFTKRARKYCDKAVSKAELGSPNAIAETWEGVLYTKVILPSMREALAAEGFDADEYTADWLAYLDAVTDNDATTAATISARLVEWNCAYQDRLGIADCTSTTDEVE